MAPMAALRLPSTRTGILRYRSGISHRLARSTAGSPETDHPGEDGEDGDHSAIRPSKHTPRPLQLIRGSVALGGPLRPLRLIRQDLHNLRRRYLSDWTLFNQLVFASAVYVLFTNLLPGITFASDLYVLTGQNWGTIEVVFSTGLCGLIFSIFNWYAGGGTSSMTFHDILEGAVSGVAVYIASSSVYVLVSDELDQSTLERLEKVLAIESTLNRSDRGLLKYSCPRRFSIQPLTILGVTGPFSVLAENIFTLCTTSFNIPFLPFMCWSLLHASWQLSLLAVFNAHDYTMRYVTTFSTEIFSLLNSIIYFHKAIQEIQRVHYNLSFAAFLYTIIGAIGTMLLAIFLSTAESWKPLFHRYLRMGLTEYAAAISVIIFIGMPYVGELATLDKSTLPISNTFRPTSPDRTVFFVQFWKLPIRWIFSAVVPGFIITVLFFFDHEVSSIICTVDRYRTRKPGGFAWDIVLLGITTGVCGILGIPPANGLLPQAPLHSESLMHAEREEVQIVVDGEPRTEIRETKYVYEQRWSAFLQAGAILMFIVPPFQRVLGLTSTSVLAGLFLFMGEQSLSVNPILYRFFYLLTPASELPTLPPAVKGYKGVHVYTVVQIVITVIIFIVTLTKGAPAFPVIIIALVPLRLLVMNKLWARDTLRFVDAWACRAGTPEDDVAREAGTGIELEPTQAAAPGV